MLVALRKSSAKNVFVLFQLPQFPFCTCSEFRCVYSCGFFFQVAPSLEVPSSPSLTLNPNPQWSGSTQILIPCLLSYVLLHLSCSIPGFSMSSALRNVTDADTGYAFSMSLIKIAPRFLCFIRACTAQRKWALIDPGTGLRWKTEISHASNVQY